MNFSTSVALWFGLWSVTALHATFVAFALIVLVRVFRRSNPALAHSIVLGGGLCFLAIPISLLLLQNRSWMPLDLVDSNPSRMASSSDLQSLPTVNVDDAIDSGTTTKSIVDIPESSKSLSPNEPERLKKREADSSEDEGSQPVRKLSVTPQQQVEQYPIASPLRFNEVADNLRFGILIVVLSGAIIHIFVLAIAFFNIQRITNRSANVDQDVSRLASELAIQFGVRYYQVKVSREIQRPMLWGFFRAAIVLPHSSCDWSKEEMQSVMAHEFAHASRGDHRAKIAFQTILAFYWYHPLVRWLVRRSETLAELSADDLCIARGQHGIELSECLVNFASGKSGHLVGLQFASFGELRERVERLTRGSHSAWRISRAGQCLQACLAIFVALLLSLGVGLGHRQIARSIGEQLPTAPHSMSEAIENALEKLSTQPQWSHLPLDLENQIRQLRLSGPEFNVNVQLLDEDSHPVAHTLCAIIENSLERINRDAFSGHGYIQYERLPIGIGVSNDQGKCLLEKIRGGPPAGNENGIVRPLLVVLHPEYGIRILPLQRTNRIQSITLKLTSGKIVSGTVSDLEGEPVANAKINLRIRLLPKARDHYSDLLDRVSILHPEIRTRSDGSFAIEGLPPLHFVNFAPQKSGMELDTTQFGETNNYISTGVTHLEFTMRPPVRPVLRFQCLDRDGKDSPPTPMKSPLFKDSSSFDRDAHGYYSTTAYGMGGDPNKDDTQFFLSCLMPSPWVSVEHFRMARDCREPFDILVTKGRVVRGKVVDALTDIPLAGLGIYGYVKLTEDQIKEFNQHKSPFTSQRAYDISDENGEFELLVSDDAWQIAVDGPIHGYRMHEPNSSRRYAVSEIQAGIESPREIVFKLYPQNKLRGLLLAADGTPVSFTEVSCSYFHEERIETVCNTNEQGEFELLPPPGTTTQYELSAKTSDGQATLTISSDWEKSNPNGFKLKFVPPTHRIVEGRILVDGVGKPNIRVAISKGRDQRIAYSTGITVGSDPLVGHAIAHATTNEDGRYEITVPETEHGNANFRILSPVELSNVSQSPYVSLDNPRNQGPTYEFVTNTGRHSIRGRVVGLDGKPFPGASIFLSVEWGNVHVVGGTQQFATSTKSDAEGRFAFEGLPNVGFRLQVQSTHRNDLWHLTVNRVCLAGDSDVEIVMDESLTQPPPKIAPVATRPRQPSPALTK